MLVPAVTNSMAPSRSETAISWITIRSVRSFNATFHESEHAAERPRRTRLEAEPGARPHNRGTERDGVGHMKAQNGYLAESKRCALRNRDAVLLFGDGQECPTTRQRVERLVDVR